MADHASGDATRERDQSGGPIRRRASTGSHWSSARNSVDDDKLQLRAEVKAKRAPNTKRGSVVSFFTSKSSKADDAAAAAELERRAEAAAARLSKAQPERPEQAPPKPKRAPSAPVQGALRSRTVRRLSTLLRPRGGEGDLKQSPWTGGGDEAPATAVAAAPPSTEAGPPRMDHSRSVSAVSSETSDKLDEAARKHGIAAQTSWLLDAMLAADDDFDEGEAKTPGTAITRKRLLEREMEAAETARLKREEADGQASAAHLAPRAFSPHASHALRLARCASRLTRCASRLAPRASHLAPFYLAPRAIEPAVRRTRAQVEEIAQRSKEEILLAVVRLQARSRGRAARNEHGDDVLTAQVMAAARREMEASMARMGQVLGNDIVVKRPSAIMIDQARNKGGPKGGAKGGAEGGGRDGGIGGGTKNGGAAFATPTPARGYADAVQQADTAKSTVTPIPPLTLATATATPTTAATAAATAAPAPLVVATGGESGRSSLGGVSIEGGATPAGGVSGGARALAILRSRWRQSYCVDELTGRAVAGCTYSPRSRVRTTLPCRRVPPHHLTTSPRYRVPRVLSRVSFAAIPHGCATAPVPTSAHVPSQVACCHRTARSRLTAHPHGPIHCSTAPPLSARGCSTSTPTALDSSRLRRWGVASGAGCWLR